MTISLTCFIYAFAVNSDANTKRIHYVEQCFGNSGVVSHGD